MSAIAGTAHASMSLIHSASDFQIIPVQATVPRHARYGQRLRMWLKIVRERLNPGAEHRRDRDQPSSTSQRRLTKAWSRAHQRFFLRQRCVQRPSSGTTWLWAEAPIKGLNIFEYNNKQQRGQGFYGLGAGRY